MKTQFLTFVAGTLGGVALAWGIFRHPGHEGVREADAESTHHTERSGLKLNDELRESMGLEVMVVSATNAPVVTLVHATVVDVTPLVQLFNEVSLARLHAEASEVEFRRLKVLYEQSQSASARAYEAGELAMKRDRMAVATAENKLRLLLGTELFESSDLASLMDGLVRRKIGLIRLQIPPGSDASMTPRSAWARSMDSRDGTVPLRVVGRASVQENTTEAGAFWAIRDESKTIGGGGGGAVEAWVEAADSKVSGVLLPSSAIVRHEGSASVYVVKEEGKLERVRIRLEGKLINGWVVSGGVTNGNQVIVTGAQQLLSSELKPSGGEE